MRFTADGKGLLLGSTGAIRLLDIATGRVTQAGTADLAMTVDGSRVGD